jgi:GDPmannose 4,6-dehydratase
MISPLPAMADTALITGITGQDGSYLAQLLLSRGYSVFGLVRGQNNPRLSTVASLAPGVEFIEGDLLDQSSLIAALEMCQPTEVYNLGAISFVGLSFKQALLTGEITGLGVTRILEAIRTVNDRIRFYQASSSEMFGKVRETPQTELTPFHPRSPYGVAKTYAHHMTVNYRESYGMFACSGILFNHESPRRGLEFVTRKITTAAARISLGIQQTLQLGNLDAKRDWGFAGDYVQAMHAMLLHPEPDDYVVATGEAHSIREFLDLAFARVGLRWEDHVTTDPRFIRPAEVDHLVGDATKARKKLGWQPAMSLTELVNLMVDSDLVAQRATLRERAGDGSATDTAP